MLKDFKKFLEEVDIKGNPGIPGQGDKRKGEEDYLSKVETRAKNRLGIRNSDLPTPTPMGPRPSRKEMELGRRMMELLPTSIDLISGKESEISELATNIIYNLYKDIIDRYNIELDIKIIKPGKVKDFMDEGEQEEPPQFRRIRDENTIKEIHKRKIANLITQGEAKNTKHILHLEEAKEGLKEILGNSDGEELFNVLDELSKIADTLDWIIPEEVKAQLMEIAPDGLAGACRVDWKPKETEEEEEEDNDDLISKALANDDDDDDEYTEDEEIGDGSTPVLRARGVDFSMLLHEAVKALFEFLSLEGLPIAKGEEDMDGGKGGPETEKLLKTIYSNTGTGDEPQDFKYGPEIAADIRDFVNKNEKIDLYPNVREELWKVMVSRKTMPTDQFLELIRGILSNTEKARTDLDIIINRVVNLIKQEKDVFNEYQKKMMEYEEEMRQYEEEKNRTKEEEDGELATGDEPDSDIDKLIKKSLYNKNDDSKGKKYSEMSPSELQKEMDDALDSENYELAGEISKYMTKESKMVYSNELKIINEKLNPHTK